METDGKQVETHGNQWENHENQWETYETSEKPMENSRKPIDCGSYAIIPSSPHLTQNEGDRSLVKWLWILESCLLRYATSKILQIANFSEISRSIRFNVSPSPNFS